MKKILITTTLCFFCLVCSSISAERYLTKSQTIKIGVSSVGITLLGLITEHSVGESKSSLIKGPILFDKYVQNHIGGDLALNRLKTNWLDNKRGALVTPFVGVTFLLVADFTHYSKNRNKLLLQDCFLFSTGLMATGGVTSLFKGLVARERPYYHVQSDSSSNFKKTDKLSFFSGHTSLAFYSMHYLNKRLSTIMKENQVSQKWQLVKSMSCYGLASYVGYSRIHVSKHYATDVLVGAGVGVLVAKLFYSYNEQKSSNFSVLSSNSKIILRYHF